MINKSSLLLVFNEFKNKERLHEINQTELKDYLGFKLNQHKIKNK